MNEGTNRAQQEQRILAALEQKIQGLEADRDELSAVIQALRGHPTCNEIWVAISYIALSGGVAAAAALRDAGIRKSPTSLYHPRDVLRVATTSEKVPEPIRRLALRKLEINFGKTQNSFG